MTKRQKIAEMSKLGYKIIIKHNKDKEEKKVIYKGKYSKPYNSPVSYSDEWNDYDIMVDRVDDLMNWANKKVIEVIY